jgi:hypothetical protein
MRLTSPPLIISLPLALFLCGAFQSCAALHPSHSGCADGVAGEEHGDESCDSDTAKKKHADLSLDIEKKERELHLAKLGLKITGKKLGVTTRAGHNAVDLAREKLKAAEDALGHYTKVEAPAKLNLQQLTRDSAEFRLKQKLQEQEQMELEYGPHLTDEHARKTGEIVIWRGRKAIEFAQRRLEMSRAEGASLDSYEIPRNVVSLESAVRIAREALGRAENEVLIGELEAIVSFTKAENKIDLFEYELKKLHEQAAQSD